MKKDFQRERNLKAAKLRVLPPRRATIAVPLTLKPEEETLGQEGPQEAEVDLQHVTGTSVFDLNRDLGCLGKVF